MKNPVTDSKAWLINPFSEGLRKKFHAHCLMLGKPMHQVLAELVEKEINKKLKKGQS